MARNCLVIGGNGFLGSHLVDVLARAGHNVTAFDRFSRGIVAPHDQSVRRVVGDFLNRADLEHAIEGQDDVFHFLSTTTPASADDEPSLDLRTNLAQTVTLLEQCSRAGIKRVYFASTGGAIYGPQGRESYGELDITLPVSPYAIGKLAIEGYLRYFHAKHGLESVTFRISNPYGPNQSSSKTQGLIPIVLNRIRNGMSVIRLGDGNMVRDYVYVEDLMSMIVHITNGQPKYRVYNLGSGTGHSVNEVLDIARRVTRRNFVIEELNMPPTFVDRSVLDVSRYESEFGKAPATPLSDGMQKTWQAIERRGS